MKKLIACAAAGALAVCIALVGCSGGSAAGDGSDASAPVGQTSTIGEELPDAAEELSGGWTAVVELAGSDLSAEEQEMFQKALKAADEDSYEPVVVLATQLVSGENSAYLCAEADDASDGAIGWTIVTVYRDLEGNAQITNAQPIDLADLRTSEDPADADMVGAWEVHDAESGVAMTPDAADALNTAMADYEGLEFNPLALLGTQIVAGENYLILGTGAPVVQDPVTELYVMKVYRDLEGEAEVLDAAKLDLLAYV